MAIANKAGPRQQRSARRWVTGGASLLLAAGLAPALTAAAAAAPVTDCPLRDRPFSLESPLIDVLLSPAARAVIEKEVPDKLSKLPPQFGGTTAPTFSAILSVRTGLGFLQATPEAVQRIDAGLKKLPVTAADRVARCARYDNDDPRLTVPAGKPRVLLFEKMTGFRDGPSVEAAKVAIQAMAAREGWALAVTDKGGAITPAGLKKFDVLIWNNISGDVLTLSQRRALEGYMKNGGGFVALHGAGGDPSYFWDWYVDTLIGARFAGHPMNPQFQDARVVIENPTRNAIGRDLAPGWTMKDEWYSFKTNPRAGGANVIATLDEKTYSPIGRMGQNLVMGDHPIAWTKCIGNGRSFYTAIGHRPESYSEVNTVKLVTQAVRWAADMGDTHCVAGKEAAR